MYRITKYSDNKCMATSNSKRTTNLPIIFESPVSRQSRLLMASMPEFSSNFILTLMAFDVVAKQYFNIYWWIRWIYGWKYEFSILSIMDGLHEIVLSAYIVDLIDQFIFTGPAEPPALMMTANYSTQMSLKSVTTTILLLIWKGSCLRNELWGDDLLLVVVGAWRTFQGTDHLNLTSPTFPSAARAFSWRILMLDVCCIADFWCFECFLCFVFEKRWRRRLACWGGRLSGKPNIRIADIRRILSGYPQDICCIFGRWLISAGYPSLEYLVLYSNL